MNGYFATLVSRARGDAAPARLRPRVPSWFEARADATFDAARRSSSWDNAAGVSRRWPDADAHGDEQSAIDPFAPNGDARLLRSAPAAPLAETRGGSAHAGHPPASPQPGRAASVSVSMPFSADGLTRRAHDAVDIDAETGTGSRAASPPSVRTPKPRRDTGSHDPAGAARAAGIATPSRMASVPTPTGRASGVVVPRPSAIEPIRPASNPRWPATRPARGAPDDRGAAREETTVVISIGRIDVRASPAPPETRARETPGGPRAMTLDEYLRSRTERDR
ncbi:hypothetical protein [Burkholderia sp. F1]|uniref:hypothetical protein n=1 Tax=Burkholderia sp. F1 TaxID=3366817 RepID=UPI003D758FCF